MTRRIIWSDTAQDDYLSILAYIARDDPQAAARVAERIDVAAAALADFTTERVGRVAGTYEKVLSGLPYILAYEIVGHRTVRWSRSCA